MSEAAEPDPVFQELLRIHRDVDEAASHLERRHVGRLQCRRGCHDCCVDGITVFEIEAARIRRRHADLLRTAAPHPEGACAFLDDEGACRIYTDRPYVCRTQGLPLRWFDEAETGEIVERRDICPLNDKGAALTELEAEACWLIGPFESRLSSLQNRVDEDRGRRVALRALFSRTMERSRPGPSA